MVTTRAWLQGRAKYLAMAIFNKTKFRLEWEYIYSRLCESIYTEDEVKKLIFINWSEYQVIRKKIWQECPPKPRTNFDKITESVEILALTISNCITSCEDCPAYENVCEGTSKSCPAKIRKWLQKECD